MGDQLGGVEERLPAVTDACGLFGLRTGPNGRLELSIDGNQERVEVDWLLTSFERLKSKSTY